MAAIATHLSRLRVGDERTWATLDATARACGPQAGFTHLASLLAARVRAGVASSGDDSSSGSSRGDEGSAASWLVEQVERAAVANLHAASPQVRPTSAAAGALSVACGARPVRRGRGLVLGALGPLHSRRPGPDSTPSLACFLDR